MQKIMFNDKYGLTQAVLGGRKTITRRIIPELVVGSMFDFSEFGIDDKGRVYIWERVRGIDIYPKYQPGEVVAVAQNLRDMGYNPRDTKHKPGEIWGLDHSPAWTNKMFVSASECIHQICITNVRVERLQDIPDEDCLREGITTITEGKLGVGNAFGWDTKADRLKRESFFSARAAFAALIDKVSGNGTWESNPWVFVYEFELVK